MSRRARFLLALLVLGLTLVAIWSAASRGEALAHRIVVRQISDAFSGHVRIGAVEVDFIPPGLRLRDLEIDDESGTLLARITEAEGSLAVGISLWEGTWIVDLDVVGVEVVIDEGSSFWANRPEGETWEGGQPIGLLPRSLRVQEARVEWRSKEEGTRAAVEAVQLQGDLRGLLEARVAFTGHGRAWVERGGRRIEISRVLVRGEGNRSGVKLEGAEVEGELGSLGGSGSWTAAGMDAHLVADLALEPLLALIPEAGEIRGRAGIEARIEGPAREPRIHAHLKAHEVVIEDVVFSGTGDLHSHGTDWRLAPASVEIFGGRADAEATGRFTRKIPYSLKGSFESWVPSRFLQLFDLDVPVRGAWDGTLRLRGHLLADDLEGDGRFQLTDAGETLRGDAEFEVRQDSAKVRGSIGDVRGGRLTCQYAVQSGRIGGRTRLEGPSFSKILRFVGLAVDGSGSVDGAFQGTVDAPRLVGTLDLQDLEIAGMSVGPARGPYELSSRSVRSAGIEILGGSLRLMGAYPLVAGEIARWSVEAEGLPLERAIGALQALRPGFPRVAASGSIEAKLQGEGHWTAPKLEGQLRISELRLGPEGPGTFAGRMWGGKDAWQLDGLLSFEEALELRVAVASTSGSLSGSFTSDAGRLERFSLIRERWPGMKGVFHLNAVVGGTLEEPELSAKLGIDSISWKDESLGSANATLRLREDTLTWEATAQDRWTFRGSARASPLVPFEMEGEWTDLDLRPFLAPDSDAEIRFSGRGRLKGRLEQPLGAGQIEIENLSIRRETLSFRSEQPTRVTIRDGRAQLQPITLSDGTQRVTFDGDIARTRSEITARGRGDLGLVETILPGLASARGTLDIDVAARRNHDRPWELFGLARVENGALDLGLLVGVTEVSGEVRFEGRRAQVLDLSGRLGGGGFLVAGEVRSDAGWDLGWAVRDASFGVPDWLDYRASGNGRFSGPFGRPRLNGDVEITQALYDRRVDWGEFLPWFRREAQRSRAGAELPVALDLRVFGNGGIFIDNNLVEAELEARFNVRNGRDDVRWSGRLDVIDGRFTFRRRSFVITAGSVQFHERSPLNPDLEFRGETTVTTTDGDYEIIVHVAGTAENPRIEFTADDPTLTENDILALVTFGRTVSQLQAQGAGIELSEVLALTAGPKAGEVEERIYDVLLVDRIEIQPSFSRTTGATEPRLSIGKDLTEGLRALLSTGLGSERQQDVALEYQLTPRIAVQGVWESQTKSQAGAFGGDVMFRYSFRTFRQFSLLPHREERAQ